MANAERETFIKVNDHMPDHPKIEGLSDKAFRAIVSLWCWCSVNKTDGHVPASSWKKRAPGKVGRELIDAKLAHPQPDGDVELHDYTKHQRSREHIEAVSKKRAEAGQRGGRAKATSKQNAKQSANQPASNTASPPNPEDRGGTSYLPDRETDSAPSERPADAGAPPTDPPRAETTAVVEAAEKLTEIKRAQEITKAYVERVPLSRFPAVLGVVRKAVQSGRYGDEQISDALIRLAAEGRAVTVDVLRYELDGQPPPRQQARPSKTSTTVAGLQARKTGTGSTVRAVPGGEEP